MGLMHNQRSILKPFPRRQRQRIHLLLGILVLMPAILYGQPKRNQNASQTIPIVVAPVEGQDNFGDTLEALGTTRANESVEITANVTEFVREIRFEDGDMVRKGDLLVVLEKDQEEAALKSAKALRAERKASFSRAQELVQQQALSTATLEERDALLQQIEGTIEGIEAQLRDRVIRAPFDGVLGLRQISPGSLVRPGDLITTIDDLKWIKIDFDAPSVFLQALRPGLTIHGRVDAYPGELFTGTISTIASRVDPVTRTISVRAIMPNEDGRLLPGLLMSIELIKNPRKSLLIPEGAILQRGTQSFAYVIERREGASIAEEKRVQMGARIPGKVEITSGLVEGDQVIVHGLMQVRPGQAVEIIGIQTGDEPLASFTGDQPNSNGKR